MKEKSLKIFSFYYFLKFESMNNKYHTALNQGEKGTNDKKKKRCN